MQFLKNVEKVTSRLHNIIWDIKEWRKDKIESVFPPAQLYASLRTKELLTYTKLTY